MFLLLSLLACAPDATDPAQLGDFVFEDHWWRVRSSDQLDGGPECNESGDGDECRECIRLEPDGLYRYEERFTSGEATYEYSAIVQGSYTLVDAAADGYRHDATGRPAQVYDVGGVEFEVVGGANESWAIPDGDRTIYGLGDAVVVNYGCALNSVPE